MSKSNAVVLPAVLQGGRAPPPLDSKYLPKIGEIGEKWGKEGEIRERQEKWKKKNNGKEKAKSRKVFLFTPPDGAGYATEVLAQDVLLSVKTLQMCNEYP